MQLLSEPDELFGIPPFTHSGILPPYLGDSPGDMPDLMSPYVTCIAHIVNRFGFSEKRREILKGLIKYRAHLRELGISEGFQWIDGSFVESKAVPKDVDIVTFVDWEMPELNADERVKLEESMHILVNPLSIDNFLCDARFVNFFYSKRDKLVSVSRYWFGLFSHRRETFEWKGLLQIPLDQCADSVALEALNAGGQDE